MYESFRIIDDFIKDVFGFALLSKSKDPRIKATGIRELSDAHDTMMAILRQRRTPLSHEFIRDIYPMLEVSLHWEQVKKQGKLSTDFLEQSTARMRQFENYYGSIFELDMACRCLLSGWGIQFIEDCTKKGEKQIDFVFLQKAKTIGVECLSKRATAIYSPDNLTIEQINDDLNDHANKFKSEHIDKNSITLDERVIVVDITTSAYQPPTHLLAELTNTRINENLDRVVFTWREDIVEGQDHDLVVKYQSVGTRDHYRYFTITYIARFHGAAFFVGRHTEPEPKVTSPSGLIGSP